MKKELNDYKWQAAVGTVLAVGAVVFASLTKRKGKFWWFAGGSLAGGAIGHLIDANQKSVDAVIKK